VSFPRSQAVAPGRYIPLARITGAEVLPSMHPVAVEVSKTTIHGRAPQIFAVGVRMIRAALRADPRLAAGLAAVLPEASAGRAASALGVAEENPADLSSGAVAGRLYASSPAVSTVSGEKIFAAAVTDRPGVGREGVTSVREAAERERGEVSGSPLSQGAPSAGLPVVKVAVA
jgi:hypothetical protein